MNCKPGDLVVVVKDLLFQQNIGRFGIVIELADERDFYPSPVDLPGIEWCIRPCTVMTGFDDAFAVVTDGEDISLRDVDLKPIRDPGDDAQDETLEWLPVPTKEGQPA